MAQKTNGRWGNQVPDDPEQARELLIDAAEVCLAKYGPAKTTVEDVASTARVSRATVYRYFDGRDELILGVLMRAADRFLVRLRKVIARQNSVEDSIVESVLFTVDAVRSDERLSGLFAPESVGHTMRVAGASQALIEKVQEMLSPVLGPALEQGLLRPNVTIDDAAEWLVRVVESILTVESKRRTRKDWAAFLHTYVVPSLVPVDERAPALRSRRGR